MGEFKRLLDETIKQYKIRLCKNKDIYNLSWKDVAEIINNETGDKFSQDKYRKWYYAWSEGYEDGIDEHVVDDELLQKIEEERLKLAEEKVKVQDQRRELKKIVVDNARFNHLKEEVMKVIKESENINFDFKTREYLPSNKHGVLLLGDWHVGLEVKNYWNTYNLDEFQKRIEKLTRKTIEHGRFNNIETLHVFGLGDLVNGIIHITTRLSSEENIINQTKIVAETLSKMLLEFAKHFNNVEYYMVTGNHGRVSPNKKESIEQENFEEFIMWYLEARLGHISSIKLHNNKFDDGIIVADILGHTCFSVHGDKDKIGNVAQNLTLMLKVIPEYVFTADKHHLEENEIHGVEVIINRSLSGVDSYAKDIRKTSYAGQTFMIFSKEEGRECTYNIKLNN